MNQQPHCQLARGPTGASQKHVRAQFSMTARVIPEMLADDTLIATAEAAAQACIESLKKGGKVLLAGDGGSAADAQYIPAEFVNRLTVDRVGMVAIALTTDASILTAVGNDYGLEQLFARQLEILGPKGDVFIAYSTSGKSQNILCALQAARTRTVIFVGMTGSRGGLMVALCGHCLIVPCADTAKIQEGHLVLGHVLCGLVEGALFGEVP